MALADTRTQEASQERERGLRSRVVDALFGWESLDALYNKGGLWGRLLHAARVRLLQRLVSPQTLAEAEEEFSYREIQRILQDKDQWQGKEETKRWMQEHFRADD